MLKPNLLLVALVWTRLFEDRAMEAYVLCKMADLWMEGVMA